MQNTNERIEMACPLNGGACISGVRDDFKKAANGRPLLCRWWIHLYGKDPQSDKTIDQWDCSIAWQPTLQTEGAQMTRQAGASIDEMRNIFAGLVRPRAAEMNGPERGGQIDHKDDHNGNH